MSSQPVPLSYEQKQVKKRRMLWLLTAVLLFSAAGVGIVFGPQWRSRWIATEVNQLVSEADAHLKAGDIDHALAIIGKAFSQSPNEPRTLRFLANFHDQLPGGAEQSIVFWTQLIRTGAATDDDRISYCRTCLRRDKPDEARDAFAALPPQTRDSLRGLEFQAEFYARMGDATKAEQTLRQAWSAEKDNPECRARLAGLDMQSPFHEVRAAAEADLWKLAEGPAPISELALLLLAKSQRLEAAQHARILDLLEKTDTRAGTSFYTTVDYCITADTTLLPRAIALIRRKVPLTGAVQQGLFYQWLTKHHQNETILAELPAGKAVEQRELFIAYTEALTQTRRWNELKSILESPKVPLNKVELCLLKACSAQGLKESDESIRVHLLTAEDSAARAGDIRSLLQVAGGAEAFGQLDIAVSTCMTIAANRSFRLDMLKRVYDLNHRQQDALAMLDTARHILNERPGLAPYAEDEIYLELLAGESLEEALVKSSVSSTAGTAGLSSALSAWYAGDRTALSDKLASVRPELLSSGKKAVYAGLLRSAGRQADAVAVAEKIPSDSLLEEELWFLKMALN